jgi:hypothetical protein
MRLQYDPGGDTQIFGGRGRKSPAELAVEEQAAAEREHRAQARQDSRDAAALEAHQARAATFLQGTVATKLAEDAERGGSGHQPEQYEESLETVEDVLICLFLKTSVSRIGVPRVRILEVFREVDKHNRGSIDIEDLNYFLLKCKIRYTECSVPPLCLP